MSSTNLSTTSYIAIQAEKRARRAARLNEWVSQPVAAERAFFNDPPFEEEKPAAHAGRIAAFWVLAAITHVAVFGGIRAFSYAMPELPAVQVITEQVLLHVDTPTPVKPMSQQKAVAEEEPVVEEPVVEETPKAKPKISRKAPPDPVDQKPEPTPAKPVRRVIGISMSSTVSTGNGPAFAVGNTRMGETGQVADDAKKVERLTGARSIRGGDAGEPVNRVATMIPTATNQFEKPKRIGGTIAPEYPMGLKSRGIEGDVVVLIVIDEDGFVQNVRVIQSSGYTEFDEEAKKAALREKYTPAARDGSPVSYNLKYTYRFRIKGV